VAKSNVYFMACFESPLADERRRVVFGIIPDESERFFGHFSVDTEM
jgi:hypothetical protein